MPAEGLPTLLTFIGFLPSVDSAMDGEGMLKLEGLPTVNTFLRLLPRVHGLVQTKVVPGLEGLPTEALVRLLPAVGCSMSAKS